MLKIHNSHRSKASQNEWVEWVWDENETLLQTEMRENTFRISLLRCDDDDKCHENFSIFVKFKMEIPTNNGNWKFFPNCPQLFHSNNNSKNHCEQIFYPFIHLRWDLGSWINSISGFFSWSEESDDFAEFLRDEENLSINQTSNEEW